jgi:hypothetical protein
VQLGREQAGDDIGGEAKENISRERFRIPCRRFDSAWYPVPLPAAGISQKGGDRVRRFKIWKEDVFAYRVIVPDADTERIEEAAKATGLVVQITHQQRIGESDFSIYLSRRCEDAEVAQFATGDWIREALEAS